MIRIDQVRRLSAHTDRPKPFIDTSQRSFQANIRPKCALDSVIPEQNKPVCLLLLRRRVDSLPASPIDAESYVQKELAELVIVWLAPSFIDELPSHLLIKL